MIYVELFLVKKNHAKPGGGAMIGPGEHNCWS
ncbi:MAG: hypothetical protein XD63_0217 [Thermoanaerobacterales bacterium 50_218]|nr:MAG: hypothetical protein XD63_0217 [Thermoanaerobacterales bacterium 50_218]